MAAIPKQPGWIASAQRIVSSPMYATATTVLAVLAGLLGSVYQNDIARAFPLLWTRPWGHRVPIGARDRTWNGEVRRLFHEADLRVVQTPLQAPNANAYAERFVRSIEEELLDRMIPLGERHFRRALTERNHQGIGNQLIEGASPRRDGKVRGCPRLGGLVNHYERAA